MKFDISALIVAAVLVSVSENLEQQTLVGDWFSVPIIIINGLLLVAIRWRWFRDTLSLTYTGVLTRLVIDFLCCGIIVTTAVLAINTYPLHDEVKTLRRDIVDNYKKGPKGIRSVIITDPDKMIKIGYDYTEYKYIELKVRPGLLFMDVIEDYTLYQ